MSKYILVQYGRLWWLPAWWPKWLRPISARPKEWVMWLDAEKFRVVRWKYGRPACGTALAEMNSGCYGFMSEDHVITTKGE